MFSSIRSVRHRSQCTGVVDYVSKWTQIKDSAKSRSNRSVARRCSVCLCFPTYIPPYYQQFHIIDSTQTSTLMMVVLVRFLRLSSLLVLHVVAFSGGASAGGGRRRAPYTEEERQAKYIERNHTFPFPEYTPNTEGVFSRSFFLLSVVDTHFEPSDCVTVFLSSSSSSSSSSIPRRKIFGKDGDRSWTNGSLRFVHWKTHR